MSSDQKRTIFYHHPCLDGVTSAWAAYQAYGDAVQYVGLDHADYKTIETTILNHVTPDTIATFIDFAPRQEILKSVLDHVQKVEVLDHHITAEKDLAPYLNHEKCDIVFDMDRSGASIAYDTYVGHGKPRPLFIQLVENFDLYKPERFESLDQFYLIGSFFSTIDVNRPFDKVRPEIDDLCKVDNIVEFERLGEAPRQDYRKKIDTVLDAASLVNLNFLDNGQGLTQVPVSKGHIRDLGHEFSPLFLDTCPMPEKIGFLWSYHDEDTIKISFRSDGNVDVSLIAEELGQNYGLNGGGHKGAASVRFTIDQFEQFAAQSGVSFDKS